MSLKLRKVSRGPHLPTLVASSITREIAQGRLRPGDQLPTEQALATTFGVSRNVVREAIARLRYEGRIWSQQGRGAFVSEASQSSVLKIEHDSQQPGDTFDSLFQFRGILEVQAAGLAAKSYAAADLEAMRTALGIMSASLFGSVGWLRGDLEFHQAIARATHNTYVIQIVTFVAERVRESIIAAGNQHRSDEMALMTEREHHEILGAIEARDEAAAEQAMRRHLAAARTRITAKPSLEVGEEPVAKSSEALNPLDESLSAKPRPRRLASTNRQSRAGS
jgi:GntR family transcriptional regulator, transcriptional repressor for pyruvate dehydrogenase complex